MGYVRKIAKWTKCAFIGEVKISGACEAKKLKYEHDCVQYQTSDMCLNGAHAGLCDYVSDVCTHVCYSLEEKLQEVETYHWHQQIVQVSKDF